MHYIIYGTRYWLVMTSECYSLYINSSNIHKGGSKVIGSLLLRNPAAMHVLSANQLESIEEVQDECHYDQKSKTLGPY